MNSLNKVVFNTGVLYSKMLITLVITLYSTRIVLNALGTSDYGLFCLVAGVIGMLSFLNTAMTISTQRYLSYYMGLNDQLKLKQIFQSSIILHLIIGITVVILFEIVGFFLFRGILNIPDNRLVTAKLIYQFMVVSSFFTIISVPYDGIINSHEKMVFVAILSIFDAFGKLLIALYLTYLSEDRLIIYAGFLSLQTIILILAKRIYCRRKFDECRSLKQVSPQRKLLVELFSFAGWNLYGTLCGLFRSQGVTIILNYFFGTVINASYGIANQVNGQLSYFSSSILMAFNPQIMKSEGAGNRDRMLALSTITSKYSFLLIAFFSIPLIIDMEYVLKLWLENVPEHAVVFCQLMLLLTLVNQLTIGLQSSAQAVGKIKIYQFVIGTINLLGPIFGFVFLKFTKSDAYNALIIIIVIECIAGIFRILFMNKLGGLSIVGYIKEVLLPSILLFSVTGLITLVLHNFINLSGFYRLVATCFVSSSVLISSAYYFGINNSEKQFIHGLFSKLRLRLK